MEIYTVVNGKKYRNGYTTGSCAAAAAKASLTMLLGKNKISYVDIDTPSGIRLNLAVTDIILSEDSAKCAIVKDGGDDPDVTTGLKIFAEVKIIKGSDIIIEGAKGVGTVTLPGLKVPVGKPAINPVPMSMIHKEVKELLPDGMGAHVIISVPGGEEIAEKTYNPRLGIMGGISILGTKGIVEPMSNEAWKEALALDVSVAVSRGVKKLIFVFGNYGRDFVKQRYEIDDKYIITISNFVGYMFDKALENNIEKILIVGHVGKLIKVSAGIFHTHSRVADGRMEIMSAYAALEGASKDLVKMIYHCKTTDAAIGIIDSYGLTKVYDRIACSASMRCSQYVYNKIDIGVVLLGKVGNDGCSDLLSSEGFTLMDWKNGK